MGAELKGEELSEAKSSVKAAAVQPDPAAISKERMCSTCGIPSQVQCAVIVLADA